jgi:hypothetical protein
VVLPAWDLAVAVVLVEVGVAAVAVDAADDSK